MLAENALSRFRRVWSFDSEYFARDGDLPRPWCLCARELRTRQTLQITDFIRCPFDIESLQQDLFVVHYGSHAEWLVFNTLGWPKPAHCIDTYVEFRRHVNGRLDPLTHKPLSAALLAAARYFGIATIDMDTKDQGRQLAIRGAPFTREEMRFLLDYCQSDADTGGDLLKALVRQPDFELPYALLRGRYMQVVADMEYRGIPLNYPLYQRLVAEWDSLLQGLIKRLDPAGVFEGGHFRQAAFRHYIRSLGLEAGWPRTVTEQLATDDDTLKAMAKDHPTLLPFKELLFTKRRLHLFKLAVGSDGRHRADLRPFATRTARHAPSASQYIYGPTAWVRNLIKPPPGQALIEIDWSKQEYAIAAGLSQDPVMIAAYQSGDPYMHFAIEAGLAPPGATKSSHSEAYLIAKMTSLGLLYGQTEYGIARRLKITETEAGGLRRRHKQAYSQFWAWSSGAIDHALYHGFLENRLQWRQQFGFGDPRRRTLGLSQTSPRTCMNFPMQANGSAMLQLAAIWATEEGLQLVAPIHDALTVQCPVEAVGHTERLLSEIMHKASGLILDGLEIRTESNITGYPDHYRDEDGRGEAIWRTLLELLGTSA